MSKRAEQKASIAAYGWQSDKEGNMAEWGVHYDDTADIIWDMHQALRFELWKNQPEPKSHMTVNAFPAHQFGEEPLIKVTSKDE